MHVLILLPGRHSFHRNSKTGVLKIELRKIKKSQIYFSMSALFWRLELSKSYFGKSLLSVSIQPVYFSNLKLVFTFWMLGHKSNSFGFTAQLFTGPIWTALLKSFFPISQEYSKHKWQQYLYCRILLLNSIFWVLARYKYDTSFESRNDTWFHALCC